MKTFRLMVREMWRVGQRSFGRLLADGEPIVEIKREKWGERKCRVEA